MGQVESFEEWLKKHQPQAGMSEDDRKSQSRRIFHMHLSQAMAGFDGPIAQLIMLGVSREIVREMTDACYTYWVNRTNLEELQRDANGAGPDDGPVGA